MARYRVGDIVAFQGSAWKVTALHSLGRGGWSDNTYDLKSVKTGVVVRDVPEREIWPKNTLPPSANSLRSRNAVVQRALNSVAQNAPFYKAYAGKALATLREIQYEAEGQLRALSGHADELVEKARKAGDAKAAGDISRCQSILDDALANYVRISQRTIA